MSEDPWNTGLYLVNFALLFTHQVDSAYWKEWELFHVPGGIQLNLLTNLVLLLVALTGFSLLVDGDDSGYVFALVLAGGGIFAFAIHTFFLARGDRAFRTPASIAVLTGMLPVSIAQAAFAIAELAG